MLFNTITEAQHADKHKQRLLVVVQEDLVKKKSGKKSNYVNDIYIQQITPYYENNYYAY